MKRVWWKEDVQLKSRYPAASGISSGGTSLSAVGPANEVGFGVVLNIPSVGIMLGLIMPFVLLPRPADIGNELLGGNSMSSVCRLPRDLTGVCPSRACCDAEERVFRSRLLSALRSFRERMPLSLGGIPVVWTGYRIGDSAMASFREILTRLLRFTFDGECRLRAAGEPAEEKTAAEMGRKTSSLLPLRTAVSGEKASTPSCPALRKAPMGMRVHRSKAASAASELRATLDAASPCGDASSR